MILIKPDGNDGTAQEILRVAAEHFERAILNFELATQELTHGEAMVSSDANKMAKLLTGATNVYFTEKQRIEERRRKQRGIVYDYAIDFAAAREEIRCRMARLRDARDPADISE